MRYWTFAIAALLVSCNSRSGTSPPPPPPADTTPPVIVLVGDDPQILAFGDAYSELGANASDNVDGDLSSNIVIDASAVDTSTPGNYIVTYDVSDAAGNAAATAKRTVTVQPPVPVKTTVSVNGDIKTLNFSWTEPEYVDYYRLLENVDGHSGFTQLGADIPVGTSKVPRDIAVHLFHWLEAQYLVEACNVTGCSSSDVVTVDNVMLDTIGYFKASNTAAGDRFGTGIALSGDGKTLAASAIEGSCATGIDGDQKDNFCENSGAVYLFRLGGNHWYQEAYIKSSNTDTGDSFGAVALSLDGNTLAIGATGEDSCATGIDGDQNDNSCPDSGAVYLFRYSGDGWHQEAYVKASNTEAGDRFGTVALTDDGNTLLVGASGEDSCATGIDGAQSDNLCGDAGAGYLFHFDKDNWQQQVYIKASTAEAGDRFGSVALDRNAATLAIGAIGEDSCSSGSNGEQTDNACENSGAVFVFRQLGSEWTQQAYIKPSEPQAAVYHGDRFGIRTVLSDDGNTLAASEVSDDIAFGPFGDAYVFRFEEGDWYEQTRIQEWRLSSALAISGDGNVLALGGLVDHYVVGVFAAEPVPCDCREFFFDGAVFLHQFDGVSWNRVAYIRPSYIVNDLGSSNRGYEFGGSVALSSDASTLAVGASNEHSGATGIDGAPANEAAPGSGAVYVY